MGIFANLMTDSEWLKLLTEGELEFDGRISWGSNYTLLGRVCDGGEVSQPVVYKPRRGERPLWDFPRGSLYQRERAAYLVSEALGWGLIPLTIVRDGPYGIGMVQRFIEHDPDVHYFVIQEEVRFAQSFRQMALLDFVINNADRKGGHVLLDEEERVWAIDHGVCFHTEPKLRSVIWEFAGLGLNKSEIEGLNLLKSKIGHSYFADALLELLSESELDAILSRTKWLLQNKQFPLPGAERHYPWPPV